MPERVEWMSRKAAVAGLLASTAFFVWWGLSMGQLWPATLPFFVGVALAWAVAAVGVERRAPWASGYAAGLSVLGAMVMLPAGLHPPVTAFLAAQVLILSALALRGIGGLGLFPLDGPREPRPGEGWRRWALAFGGGLAVPWLLVVGLLPGLPYGATLVAFLAFVVGLAGVANALSGRTWGLFAMLAAIPFLLAVPEAARCYATPHDGAGELAAVALGLGLVPWIGPVVRFMRRAPR